MPPSIEASSPSPGVGLLLFNNAPRNFMTWALNEQLEKELTAFREGNIRVVVVGSAVEGYFIAHGDLPDNVETFTGGTPSGDIMAGARAFRELDRGPMVSIAAVDGQAWGGGAELCWSCDLRVASEAATFAQPEVRIGVSPAAGGATNLARIAGEGTALRLLLDGRPIDAGEAFRLGLVQRLVPAGRAVAEALEWAEWLAAQPPWSLRACKMLVKEIRGKPLGESLRHEGSVYAENFMRADALELARQAIARYEAGGDSYDAFRFERPGSGG